MDQRPIKLLYRQLFDEGRVHTVESWADGTLVGGLYGVHLGAAFFGESMFHRKTGASKVALAHLVARLAKGGFRLLDAQFVTPHLASLGAIEVTKEVYRQKLADAISHQGHFWSWPKEQRILGREVLAACPVAGGKVKVLAQRRKVSRHAKKFDNRAHSLGTCGECHYVSRSSQQHSRCIRRPARTTGSA